MQRKWVRSSNIRFLGYDLERSVLEVEFTTGRVYRYYDVPPEEFLRFAESSSKGKFFNTFIRGVYACAPCAGRLPKRRIKHAFPRKDSPRAAFDRIPGRSI